MQPCRGIPVTAALQAPPRGSSTTQRAHARVRENGAFAGIQRYAKSLAGSSKKATVAVSEETDRARYTFGARA